MANLDVQALMDALPPEGGTIQLPSGVWQAAARLVVDKPGVKIVGAGSGFGQSTATILEFDATTFASVRNSRGGVVAAATKGACVALISEGCELADFCVRPQSGRTAEDGIAVLNHACTLTNMCVTGLQRDGVSIDSSIGGVNMNNWTIDRGRFQSNGRHGIYVNGADSNAGSCRGADCTANGGWGIVDSSFLGCNWFGCHTSSNGNYPATPPVGGSFKVDGAASYAHFSGCYAENNQHPAFPEAAPTTVVGGNLPATAEAYHRMGQNRDLFRGRHGDMVVRGPQNDSSHAAALFIKHDTSSESKGFYLHDHWQQPNPPWLVDTIALARYRTTWQVPIAYTNDTHAAGAGHPIVGLPFISSPYMLLTEHTFGLAAADTWDTIQITDARFAAHNGSQNFHFAVQTPPAASPILIGGWSQDGNQLTVNVRSEGAPHPSPDYTLRVFVVRFRDA